MTVVFYTKELERCEAELNKTIEQIQLYFYYLPTQPDAIKVDELESSVIRLKHKINDLKLNISDEIKRKIKRVNSNNKEIQGQEKALDIATNEYEEMKQLKNASITRSDDKINQGFNEQSAETRITWYELAATLIVGGIVIFV
tara:strand:+ start:228 stop:656 length:429 start_codon:yes stop_codon:yes gene_type:complete